MPGGHDRHVVICFAGLGDPRSFYLEALGESWLGLWCLWGGRGAPAAQIELFELPVRAGVHVWGVQGGWWARRLCSLWPPVACWLPGCLAACLPSCLASCLAAWLPGCLA